MGDILEPLKSFQLNYLYLKRLIPIRDICIQILKQKKTVEDLETYNYHDNMWETHAGKYYNCLDNDRTDGRGLLIYSFIHNDKEIFAERDRNMTYYNYTGIPYQIRVLVLNLISDYNDYNISEEEKKSYRIEDDIKYCKIANKIIEKSKVKH
jgi:hypothetical protein